MQIVASIKKSITVLGRRKENPIIEEALVKVTRLNNSDEEKRHEAISSNKVQIFYSEDIESMELNKKPETVRSAVLYKVP